MSSTSTTPTPPSQPFSGSYHTDDVQFLLRPLALPVVSVAEKERLIQSGEKHYSDLITAEAEPSAEHLRIFAQALENGSERMAMEVAALAKALQRAAADGEIVLLSLVRAGVPLGVLLGRALRRQGRTVVHYGISIIRDRGLDPYALQWVLARHQTQNLFFVDGWTGKGAIAGQLQQSFQTHPELGQPPRLLTLADPCGVAWLAASGDDWLIPSGILGAVVSGLTSRTIYTPADGFHGCKLWLHLAEHDQSQALIHTVEKAAAKAATSDKPQLEAVWTEQDRKQHQATAQQVIETVQQRWGINDRNRIKPGIAEATRAVMRRVPDHVLIRSRQDPDVQLLLHLASEKGLVVEEVGQLIGNYRAVTLIKRVGREG